MSQHENKQLVHAALADELPLSNIPLCNWMSLVTFLHCWYICLACIFIEYVGSIVWPDISTAAYCALWDLLKFQMPHKDTNYNKY
jgi:hypothetical protein